MHFDGYFYAVIAREFGVLGPIRRDFFFPLPFEEVEVIGRPGAGDPVGIFGIVAVAWAAGEIDDYGTPSLEASSTVRRLTSA